jgi:1,5-anhydro-D-fructose reductase (1,5-anhydro-D-mannitol-forming)
VQYAGTGIEIHGSEGSVIGRNVMTQRAIGEVLLRNTQGEKAIAVEHENLYARGVASFCAAMRGEGAPAATGEDGVRSLAAALAVLQASRSGRAVDVEVNVEAAGI